ncbi:MAG TPA: AAA family ATPase [Marinagarivorans sp.]
MYHSYFGIEEQVFSIAVNPRYMYMSAQHREALAHLLYGVNSGGFVMLTGEVGTGKTTTIRCLLEQLPANADVAMVMNPAASARDLMCSICDEFGVSYDTDETSIKILTDKLYEFLLRNHSEGRTSIVLIDEAQLLRISTLEQIRLLTNLESHTQKMLQIILVGQPELNELLAKPALRQLSQRITARYHLRPLTVEETGAYIRHRLAVAGMPPGRDPFPPNVVKKVHSISGGIPRLINILCDRMLLGAFTQESTQVDKTICRQASEEVLGDPRERGLKRSAGLSRPLIYGGSAVLVTLLVCTLIWLLLTRPTDSAAPLVAEQVQTPPPALAQQPPPKKPSPQERWPRSQDQALSELLRYLGVEDESAVYPCWQASKQGLNCETLEARTWNDFLLINRPAVLSLNTPSKHAVFVTVIAIDGDNAVTLVDGEQQEASLEELGTMWTGEYVIMWQRPDAFEKAIGVGSTGPLVRWLAQEFAQLDGQSKLLAQDTFNRVLEQRVKLFQRSYRLEDDGLAGFQTLLRLGEAVGREVPLKVIEPLPGGED